MRKKTTPLVFFSLPPTTFVYHNGLCEQPAVDGAHLNDVRSQEGLLSFQHQKGKMSAGSLVHPCLPLRHAPAGGSAIFVIVSLKEKIVSMSNRNKARTKQSGFVARSELPEEMCKRQNPRCRNQLLASCCGFSELDWLVSGPNYWLVRILLLLFLEKPRRTQPTWLKQRRRDSQFFQNRQSVNMFCLMEAISSLLVAVLRVWPSHQCRIISCECPPSCVCSAIHNVDLAQANCA